MDGLRQQAIFEKIKSTITEMGYQPQYTLGGEAQNGHTLSFAMDIQLPEENAQVLCELSLLDLYEDVSMLQLFTTILPDIQPGLAELEKAIMHWNLYTTVGAFGIFYPEMQLFHRYNLLFESDIDVEDALMRVLAAYSCIQEDVGDHYELAEAMIQGVVDCKTAIEKGLMLE